MKHRFADLIDIGKLQELLDRLYRAAGIPVGIIGTDGTIHVATGWQEMCTRFHRAHPVTAQRCRESDDFISAHLNDLPYAQYRCKNGLWDIAVPIRIEGEHLATLFVGQFHFEDDRPDREFFRAQGEEFGFDQESYLKALDHLPVFSRERMRDIIDFYLLFVNQLVGDGVNRLKRLEAEKELSRQKALLHSVIDGTDDAVFVKDSAGRYVMANAETCRIFRRSIKEILGHDDTAFFPAAEAAQLMAGDREIMEEAGPVTREEHITTVEGKRTYLATKGAIRDEAGTPIGLFGISRDITERKQLEEKLRHSLKMESIGRLAGGVAHDFNNKLTVILGYAELAKMMVPREAKLSHYLSEVSRAAEHSRQITAQLLAFSRQQVVSPRILDLNVQVRQALNTLPRLIGEDVLISCQFSPSPLMVKMDPSQLDQIIMNLAANARDAMTDGGEIVITTRTATVDSDYCHDKVDASPGEYVELSFADSGVGMDGETLGRIFEPFFTTKEVGQGTGLGLATVYGIITQNGGFVAVESEEGKGTMFRIFLPRVEDVPSSDCTRAEHPLFGTGSVLLVEDDAAVRTMIASMLHSLGYRVRQAHSPREAIKICSDPSETVDLVLSDLIMPEMNGKEMVEQIRQTHPSIKALFMSGYDAGLIASRGLDSEEGHFIGKPFAMQLLSEKLAGILGRQ